MMYKLIVESIKGLIDKTYQATSERQNWSFIEFDSEYEKATDA